MKSHRGEAVVKDVLEAVREEIAKVGFHAMRIENVALRAEVAKTTIYRRWPKKEDLLFELLQSMMVGSQSLPEKGCLRDDLLSIGRYIQAMMTSAEGQAIGRVMMAERSNPEVRRAFERVREQNIHIPRKMVERARQRGEVDPGIDPEILLATLVGSIHHRILVHGEPPSDAHVAAVVDLLLNGARPRSS